MMRLFWCLSILLLLTACQPKKPATPPAAPPMGVTDFTVEAKTLPAIFDFVGFAESSHPVEIRARVEGYLDKIAYDEGQLVQQGDVLFVLDPKQYQAHVEHAKADVARQKAILENANLTVNRLTTLYAQKAASKKDLDNAISNKLAAEASLLGANAELLDNEINLSYTVITSPVTGLADKARYREGALISPQGANNLLTTVSVLDPIWIYFTVSDNDILRAKQQETSHSMTFPTNDNFSIEVIKSDGSIYPHKGKVNFNAPAYDQSTGTMLVRAVFPNPEEDLRPGEFVRVKVYGAERPDAIYVPQRALMQKKNGMFVYLIDKDNKVVAQDVSTSGWYGNYQIITNGLKPGDRIVVDGINKVRPGAAVQVIGAWSESQQAATAVNK